MWTDKVVYHQHNNETEHQSNEKYCQGEECKLKTRVDLKLSLGEPRDVMVMEKI